MIGHRDVKESVLWEEDLGSWTEMKEYVGLGEADEENLKKLAAPLAPHLDGIVDRFYIAANRFPDTHAVLAKHGAVKRLKNTMKIWIQELLEGPYDETYYQRRKEIGQVHVRVGLPLQYVFTAMNLLRTELVEITTTHFSGAQALEICLSLSRIVDLELAVMSGAYMDRREKEKLQLLQDLIVESMPVMVLCLDESGRVASMTHLNPVLLKQEIQIGNHYTECLSEALLENGGLSKSIEWALTESQPISLPDLTISSGQEVSHYRVNLVPFDHPSARLLIHLEDFTDIVDAQARAQQAERLAQVGSLAANVAHEIRNPLSAISATLQVISQSLSVNDRRREVIRKVNQQVARLDRLVTDLLGYARPVAPHLNATHLKDLVEEASAVSATSPIILIDDDPLVEVDGQHLLQILVNLLQNARDSAGDSGRVWLRVGSQMQVEITDDGSGISSGVAGRLFEPFVTSKPRGTGLGLAISRKLAESMNGTLVLVKPDPELIGDIGGPGACFRLRLRPGHP